MTDMERTRVFELRSDRLICSFTRMGAALADLSYIRSDGVPQRVILAPRSHFRGEADPSLAGRVVAPVCGRVREAVMHIDGREYALDRNEGENHLHGGRTGASFREWNPEVYSGQSIRFSLDLPDGADGFPGNRHLTVEYSVEGPVLTMNAACETDAPTFFDITNHVYHNPSGMFDSSAMDLLLQVSSRTHVCNNASHLPIRIVPSEGTAFDFTSPVSPSEMMRRYPEEEQLTIARGYNNALILDSELIRSNGFAARLTDPRSGVRMTLNTDQPCLVFYSGGYLDAGTWLASGPAVPGCALALEAQGLPDSEHLTGMQPPILRPGSIAKHFISWNYSEV